MAAQVRINPERWPSEVPLLVLTAVAAAAMWVLLTISIFGIVYAVLIAVFFFISHMAFVAYVRGSGVRLGPDQFPDLHRRVLELSRAMDMEPPDAYVMQAGGALNAFATKFIGGHIVVLFSDLLEACEDNDGARDMIIAHELGHVRCGHLKWMWFLLPGYMIPFLGGALSRAREYTCDRFGLAGAGDQSAAVHGLTILAAGPKLAPKVNVGALVAQREDTNTGLLTLGEWMGSHPPLSKRIAAISPSLAGGRYTPTRGRLTAIVILLVVAGILVAGTMGFAVAMAKFQDLLPPVDEGYPTAVDGGYEPVTLSELTAEDLEMIAQVERDFAELSEFIAEGWAGEALPEDLSEVKIRWESERAGAFPFDPFDGLDYYYILAEDGYFLGSAGPDGGEGIEEFFPLP